MFSQIIPGRASIGANPQPPSFAECTIILNSLKARSVFSRRNPDLNERKICDQVLSSLGENFGCHGVARLVAMQFGWTRESGFLVPKESDFDLFEKLNNRQTIAFGKDLTKDEKGNIWTVLHHHSVVKDFNHNYVECMPKGWYPLDKYFFIPHPSGGLGWELWAK